MTWYKSHRDKAIESKKLSALRRAKSTNQTHLSNHALKKILLTDGREYKCSLCSLKTWQDKKIHLDLDHIDGDTFNNNLTNLRFLCPNCHSQTKTFKGRNINSGKKKVSDKILLRALKKCSNIRQALIAVKLSPRGANYSRAVKLLKK